MYYLKSFCFLCLKPDRSTTLHNVDVEEKLEYLISTYHVLQLSKIPKHFCDNCLENLNRFYDFKHKCVESIIISNYYVQKLSQENGTFACLSVRLSDILHNIKLDTGNSIDVNIESMNHELNDDIFEIDNYEQHETVDIQGKVNNEQVLIKIEHETDYFEMKREITEELIIKDENSGYNDYIFECKTCMMIFSTEVLLIKHIAGCKNRKRPIKLVNQIPSVTESDNNSESTEDTSTHIVEFPYACDICQKAFREKTGLNRHKYTHTWKNQYPCGVCKKIFKQKLHLNTHKYIHTGEKPYACDICKKVFNQKANLNKHKQMHTGEKPYVCDICKKIFSQKAHLNRHKNIHTGEKPYACDVCDKTFSFDSNLDAHKRVHTGEQPYECGVCKKKFNLSSNLVKHKRIHTGEKPHACGVCKRTFSQKVNLNKHKRTHTGAKSARKDSVKI